MSIQSQLDCIGQKYNNIKNLSYKEHQIIACKNIVNNYHIVSLPKTVYDPSDEEFRKLVCDGLNMLLEQLNDEADRITY